VRAFKKPCKAVFIFRFRVVDSLFYVDKAPATVSQWLVNKVTTGRFVVANTQGPSNRKQPGTCGPRLMTIDDQAGRVDALFHVSCTGADDLPGDSQPKVTRSWSK